MNGERAAQDTQTESRIAALIQVTEVGTPSGVWAVWVESLFPGEPLEVFEANGGFPWLKRMIRVQIAQAFGDWFLAEADKDDHPTEDGFSAEAHRRAGIMQHLLLITMEKCTVHMGKPTSELLEFVTGGVS